MGIVESLKSLGIIVEDPRSVAEGIGRLVIPLEHKLKLFREYAAERNITITKDLEALLGE